MKKTTLGLLMVLMGIYTASARQINPDEALSVASDYMNSLELKSANVTTSTLRPMKAPGVDANSSVCPYYIFNRGDNEGFVIISGDDRAPKILGYSDKGSFDGDNIPPQLKGMMEQLAKQMMRLPISAPQHASWKITSDTRSGAEVLLETANWGQGFPYNTKCPVIDGEQAPTGCTATAMAIVMKYHNWPESTQGVNYTNYYNRDQTIDYSSATIDWHSINGDTSSVSYKNAVGELNVMTGIAINTIYNAEVSIADVWVVGHIMTENFKYSPDCQFIQRKMFDTETWHKMLKEQIEAGYPVIYNGNDGYNVGHAYVIDGFGKDGLYHVNWGWDGSCNGYYPIDGLIPDDRDFSQNSGMTINIIPDKSGKKYSRAFIPNGDEYLNSIIRYNGYNFSVSEIIPNEAFSFYTPFISYPWKFEGYLGIAIVDEQDNIIKKLFDDNFEESSPSSGINHMQIIDGCIRPGAPMQINDFVSPGLSEGQRYQIICYEVEDQEWRIVTGGMIHQSYFGDKGLNSEYAHINIKYDNNLPMFPEIDLSENSESLKQNTCVINFFSAGGTVTLEGQCKNEGGEVVEPSQMFIVDTHKEHYAWIISLYEDQNDFTAHWKKFENNRHEDNLDPTKIHDLDGLVYFIEDNKAILIGYDDLHISTLMVPDYIEIEGAVYPVTAIENNALTHCESIQHVSLGSNIEHVYPYGLGLLSNLESVTIPGYVDFSRVASAWSYNLKNLYLLSSDAQNCELEYLSRRYTKSAFDYEFLNLNVYSCDYTGNISSGRGLNKFIPGRGWPSDSSEEHEMWTYAIDQSHSCIKIQPEIEEIKILSVLVNGSTVTPDENSIYQVPSTKDMEVIVNYILHDFQKMTTVYEAAYNNGLPSQDLSTSVLVEYVNLSPENWSGEEGASFKIEATVMPEEATDKSLIWASSDESVATVDGEGNVSVLKEGTCVITVSAADGSGVSAECIITSLAGVEGIFSAEDNFDVYGLNGVLLKKNAGRDGLKTLTPGIYLIRQGSEMKKLVIR